MSHSSVVSSTATNRTTYADSGWRSWFCFDIAANAAAAFAAAAAADLSFCERPHDNRIRELPIAKPFICWIASSAERLETNWTKPQPFPGGIFVYKISPNGLKYSRSSCSVIGVDKPPTNTVVLCGSSCWSVGDLVVGEVAGAGRCFGVAKHTRMGRFSGPKVTPFISASARCWSAGSVNRTKPYPRDNPVSELVMILADLHEGYRLANTDCQEEEGERVKIGNRNPNIEILTYQKHAVSPVRTEVTNKDRVLGLLVLPTKKSVGQFRDTSAATPAQVPSVKQSATWSPIELESLLLVIRNQRTVVGLKGEGCFGRVSEVDKCIIYTNTLCVRECQD